MKYGVKPGAHLKIKPQAAGERLEKIRLRNKGRLLAQDVIDDARPVNSVLHPQFEWSDRKAADAYRLTQAEHLIRSIVVVHVDEFPEAPKNLRAFVSVCQEDDAQASYTSITHAMSDDELRRQVIERARQQLIAFKTQYKGYEEFAAVIAVIEATVAS